MVFFIGLCDFSISDFRKKLEATILKRKNFLEFQNEVAHLKKKVKKIGVDCFNNFQNDFLKDLDDKLNLDGGELISLWLYYFELEIESKYFTDSPVDGIFNKVIEDKILMLFLSGIGSTVLKKISAQDMSFKSIKDLCEKQSLQAGREDGIAVFEEVILLRMGILVALGEKGKTKGIITKMSSMGIKGLVSLIRGDVIMFLCVPGFTWEVDGIRLNATKSYFVSVVIGILRQIGTSNRKAEETPYFQGYMAKCKRRYPINWLELLLI